jgi:hypothetical protein
MARYKDGKLRIAETRLAASSVRFAAWPSGDDEACLTLVLRQIRIEPKARIFQASDADLCGFGLHSIARRLERGTSREDFDVAADCHALGKHFQAIVAGKSPDFRIFVAGGAGQWVGQVMVMANNRPFLLVRTYEPMSQPGGFGLKSSDRQRCRGRCAGRSRGLGRPSRWTGRRRFRPRLACSAGREPLFLMRPQALSVRANELKLRLQYASLGSKQFCNTDPLPFARAKGAPVPKSLHSTSVLIEVAMINWPEMLHHAEEWADGFLAGAATVSLIGIAGAALVLLVHPI